MSYQFEDESVLEELLNQQLDRSRVRSAQYAGAPSKPEPAAEANKSAPIARSSLATWLSKDIQATSRFAEGSATSTSLGAELSGLPEVRKPPVEDQPPSEPVSATIRRPSTRGQTAQRVVVRDDRDAPTASLPLASQPANQGQRIEEAQLQQMSKQRLIRLILDELEPSLKSSRESNDRALGNTERLAQLEQELQIEREKLQTIQREHDNKLKAVESSWLQLNKQLERRLEAQSSELVSAAETNSKLMANFEEEQHKQLQLMSQSYESRLEQQKSRFEDELRRMRELHKLELISKLKVNGDLDQLESVYANWDQTIKSTIEQLEVQFASVERLLARQASTIKGTNQSLDAKSGHIEAQGAALDARVEQFELVTDAIRGLLTDLSAKLDKANEIDRLTQKMTNQFEEFTRLNQNLSEKQREIVNEMDKLNVRRLELNAESNRLAVEAGRLELLANTNESKEASLLEQQKLIQSQKMDTDAKRAGCERKLVEIKSKLDKIQLIQRRQSGKENELAKWQAELADERKSMRKEAANVERRLNKLTSVRSSIQREFSQLQRLQKSLVCSTCLDRLYDSSNAQREPIDDMMTDRELGTALDIMKVALANQETSS